jgi:hypothetical protein
MGAPEDGEDVFEGDDIRIKGDLSYLGMASRAGAHLTISRVGYMATGITGFDFVNPFYILINSFYTPKATCA